MNYKGSIEEISIQDLAQACLDETGTGERRGRLQQVTAVLDAGRQLELAETLKSQADSLMRTDLQACLRAVECLEELAELSAAPRVQALALLSRANAYTVVMGKYREGVPLYEQAGELYASLGEQVLQAQSRIGLTIALASLGRYEEAIQQAEWARRVLQENDQWFHLARINVNMAVIQSRLGRDVEALALFDQARSAYEELGQKYQPPWLRVELNRAVILRNLGRFESAIHAGRTATDHYTKLGQEVAAARAKQTLAITYFIIGRYNESLQLLDETREVLLKDGRERQGMLVEIFISDCLLQLGRYNDVLEKCQRVRGLFSMLGTHYEVGQAILNEASAYAGLGQYARARSSLEEAREIFEREGNQVAAAEADLQEALVLLAQGDNKAALRLAQYCAGVFANWELPIWQARAQLVAGRAALQEGESEEAQQLARSVIEIAEQRGVPDLRYAGNHLLGEIAARGGEFESGLEALEEAIQDVERLCGRMMVEFRAAFVADKARLYEDAVQLCLLNGEPEKSLAYAERSKSRALLELLAHRIDLSLHARSESDQPLVQELIDLQDTRNRLYRRLESGEGYGQRGETSAFEIDRHSVEQEVLEVEKRITDLWHRLLVRNADYAREAALWQVRAEPAGPYLDEHSLLVEYFSIHGELIAFLVTKNETTPIQLGTPLSEVERLLGLLWLNFRSLSRSLQNSHSSAVLAGLEKNAQGILKQLYARVFEPLEPALKSFPGITHLLMVPHAALHYLPFQSLYDGSRYLLERYELSYLPGSSFLKYSQPRPSGEEMLSVGHSYQGQLPHAETEAESLAAIWPSSSLLLGDQATLESLRRGCSQADILHLATHGDFRGDNPLFSGLALADGWLTTLDIFNLRLKASLVTLSACQTGRSLIAGGDELLGLMRALMAAGAATQVLTLWAVEDRSTAQLMETFYRLLSKGARKGEALRSAQLVLRQENSTAHPYFWAPFFLVGDPGPLLPAPG